MLSISLILEVVMQKLSPLKFLWMADFIEESAIPQAGYRTNPLNQRCYSSVSDPTTPSRSYELPSIWAEWLEEVAIPGSGM
jgi:hypothetical protein